MFRGEYLYMGGLTDANTEEIVRDVSVETIEEKAKT